MNIYCFSTLSFAKLQFKSVINKAFHKHGVASFTDAWIETKMSRAICPLSKSRSHLLQMRGLKRRVRKHSGRPAVVASFTDAWIETIIPGNFQADEYVASFTDAWIETAKEDGVKLWFLSHLLQMRGLKPTLS